MENPAPTAAKINLWKKKQQSLWDELLRRITQRNPEDSECF
jgi:hypothetical protein